MESLRNLQFQFEDQMLISAVEGDLEDNAHNSVIMTDIIIGIESLSDLPCKSSFKRIGT